MTLALNGSKDGCFKKWGVLPKLGKGPWCLYSDRIFDGLFLQFVLLISLNCLLKWQDNDLISRKVHGVIRKSNISRRISFSSHVEFSSLFLLALIKLMNSRSNSTLWECMENPIPVNSWLIISSYYKSTIYNLVHPRSSRFQSADESTNIPKQSGIVVDKFKC